MKIVFLDSYTLNPGDLDWSVLSSRGDLRLYDRTPVEDTVERARDAEIILTNKAPLSAEDIDRLPNLRFISVAATGYNIVDIEAAGKKGVPVSNVPEYGTDSVAQFVMAMLLELCHRAGLHDDAVKAGAWIASPDWNFCKTPQILLAGQTMGVVGFGRIGRRVGELAAAFGMKVIAHTPHPRNPLPGDSFEWKSLREVFEQADVVSLHCPQTGDNEHFVNSELLGRMKPHAFFINASRGGLVDEEALTEALKQRVIAGAALDVVSREPMSADNPLLNAPNCLITPHMAWASQTARKTLMDSTAENIRAFQDGRPINVVNEQYLAKK